MISLRDVFKSYGPRVLFDSASLLVDRRDRLGVVGPNGAGKSTLLGMILGQITPDRGEVGVAKGLRIGYLPQELIPRENTCVLDSVMRVSEELERIEEQLRVLEAQLETLGDHAEADDVLKSYGEWQEKLEQLGGYDLEHKAEKILIGLGFKSADFYRPLSEMSGGWMMRATLARLLLMQPDALLLDEPSNHLDLEALLWFQDYLKVFQGGLVIISHDRDFLDQVVTGIVELERGQLTRYSGNYEDYLREREARREHLIAAQKNQGRLIAQNERFIERFRYQATKARQVQSRIKMLDKIERVDIEPERATVHFRLPQPERSSRRVVELHHVAQSYSAKPVYQDLDLTLERGERIALVGPNGAGKSTLMKILAGVVRLDSGERKLGVSVQPFYYTQFRLDMLNPNDTALASALSGSKIQSEEFVRTILGAFLFRGDDVFKKVEVLSGGEKSRLALARALLNPPNLLLLDEPTTHLDLDSVEALCDALEQYPATLVTISHDVYFLRRVANKIIRVEDGHLTVYPGDFDYYLWCRKRDQQGSEIPTAEALSGQEVAGTIGSRSDIGSPASWQSPEAKPVRPGKPKSAKQTRAVAPAKSKSGHRDLQAEMEDVELALKAAESRSEELARALQDPATYRQGDGVSALRAEFDAIQSRIAELTARWDRLAG